MSKWDHSPPRRASGFRVAASCFQSSCGADSPGEACSAQTATATGSPRRRCVPSCLTPGLRPRGRMGIGCAVAYGARMGWLVWRCRGETRASRARNPAHWRLGPCRGWALVLARSTSAHPALPSDQNRAGQFLGGAVEYPVTSATRMSSSPQA